MSSDDSTFHLGYVALPEPEHEDHELVGETFVVCWIRAASPEAAEELALAALAEERWRVIDGQGAEPVTREDYADDEEHLTYFDEAQQAGQVFVYNVSPRFPVYHVAAEVRREGDRAEAHYLVSGESVAGEDDVFDPGFWSEARALAAVDAATALIVGQGWELVRVASSGPVSYRDLPEDLRSYCDAAEEDGQCMVFGFAGGQPS